MFPDLPPDSPQIDANSHLVTEIPSDIPQIEEQQVEQRLFHLFPNLPSELRIRIWELTINPRIIKITADAKCWKLHKEKRRDGCSKFHVKQGGDIPVLREVEFNTSTTFLGANQESRHETLPFYNMAFNPAEAQSFLYGTKVTRVSALQNLKFNTVLDTLFVGPLSELKADPYFVPTSMANLRHLAIFDADAGLSDIQTTLGTLSRIMIFCPSLETFCLCILDPPASYDEKLRKGAERRRNEADAALKKEWFSARNVERWVYPNPWIRHRGSISRSPFTSDKEGYMEFAEVGKRFEKVFQVVFLSELRDGYVKPRQTPASKPLDGVVALRTSFGATFQEL